MKWQILFTILAFSVASVLCQVDPDLAAADTTETFDDLMGSDPDNFQGVTTIADGDMGEMEEGDAAGFGEDSEESLTEIAETGIYRRCRYFPCKRCGCQKSRCWGSGLEKSCRCRGPNCYCTGKKCFCVKGKKCFCQLVNCYCKKCSPPLYLGAFCKNCKWSNHIGYTHFPFDCSKFIVCIRNGNPPYEYETHLMYCPAGTYWNHDLLTCSEDIPPYNKCILKQNPHTPPPIEQCKLVPGPYPNSFIQDGIVRTCPAETIFVVKQCACILKDPTQCGDLILDLPFDHDFDDISCNQAVGEVQSNVIISPVAHKGKGSAYFTGNGFIFYALLSNYYTFKDLRQWTVSLFVLSYPKNYGQVQGLVTQADTTEQTCNTPFEIHIGGHNAITGKINSDAGTATVNGQFVPHSWTHVALRYHAPKTDLFINGVIVDTSYGANGGLINSKCPLIVGWKGKVKADGMFNGYLDNVQIYKWAKSDAFIQALY